MLCINHLFFTSPCLWGLSLCLWMEAERTRLRTLLISCCHGKSARWQLAACAIFVFLLTRFVLVFSPEHATRLKYKGAHFLSLLM